MVVPPAFLFIGSDQQCRDKAYEIVCTLLCKEKGCNACVNCSSIKKKQHYALLWLRPDESYTVAHIEHIFAVTAFALQQGERYCIVLERADLLTQTTANSILKIVEEPPSGYHFILLGQRIEGILPTIISRCVTEQLPYQEIQEKHLLFDFFSTCSVDTVTAFTKELDRHKGLERDIFLLLDQLSIWAHELIAKAHNPAEIKKAAALTTLIDQARLVPPLAGTVKLFLKNLYIRFLMQSSNK